MAKYRIPEQTPIPKPKESEHVQEFAARYLALLRRTVWIKTGNPMNNYVNRLMGCLDRVASNKHSYADAYVLKQSMIVARKPLPQKHLDELGLLRDN